MHTRIKNTNAKGQFHGYQEFISCNGEIWCRCNYKNGMVIGYQEFRPWNEITYHIT